MAAKLSDFAAKICVPTAGEKVYKDECVYSCDTPECETGLYICMKSFLGFGKKHVQRHFNKTGNAVYLHITRIRTEIPKSGDEPEKKKPTKMALGVEGGFDLDDSRIKVEEKFSIVLLPGWEEFGVDDPELPEQVTLSVAGIVAAESAAKADEAAAMTGTWEGEKRQVSRHAEKLEQLDNGVKILPKGWKCAKCDKTDNLWLNLTDGAILCGRKFWDGSGGNNHAVEHFHETRRPLAVKLGTITPDGADVYSYDEDDMVEDPLLSKHLSHFGISITSLEKTDKTMVELEVDYNQRVGEWSLIQESGSSMTPIYGPGYTGMVNLGNSCYMNSVMQVLFTLKDFNDKYTSEAERIFNNAPSTCVDNFNVQMAKLGTGLSSGDYSKEPPASNTDSTEPIVHRQNAIVPRMIRALIGRGHSEFSTKRQQDAQEYLLHVLQLTERNSRGTSNPSDCLRFTLEDRIECTTSGKVKYMQREDYMLPLPIPLEAVDNQAAVDAYKAKKAEMEAKKEYCDPREEVRQNVPFEACLSAFSAPEVVDDFYSTALNAKSIAKRTTRFATFPDYLFIQLRKFTIGDDWVPKKLDVNINVPDELDLSALRSTGLQDGEQLLPEPTEQQPEVQIDEGIVSQLVAMGFTRDGCMRAVYHTNNQGLEPALNWVMENMEDPDFNTPFVPPGSSSSSGGTAAFTPNEEAVAMLMSMGFAQHQAVKALKNTDNNLERAAEWIFSHAAELDQAEEQMDTSSGAEQPAAPKTRDGSPKYRLSAFISHMGTSTMSGHYVCHIKKGEQWVLYNDEKVTLSENLPRGLGYLYLYQRV